MSASRLTMSETKRQLKAALASVYGSAETAKELQSSGQDRPHDLESLNRELARLVAEKKDLIHGSAFDSKNNASRQESRIVLSILGLITVMIFYFWINWSDEFFKAGDDIGYDLGLYGGILLLTTFLYSAVKRLRIFHSLGDVRYWYYFHFFLGVTGAVTIVFHTTFTARSLNGTVALFSLIIVVISGIFGRYIYTRIGYGLQEIRKTYRENDLLLQQGVMRASGKVETITDIDVDLKNFFLKALYMPNSFVLLLWKVLTIRVQAHLVYLRISNKLRFVIQNVTSVHGLDSMQYDAALSRECALVKANINALVKISRYYAFERLLAIWRVLHVPLLFILFLAGVAHVLAVHMY